MGEEKARSGQKKAIKRWYDVGEAGQVEVRGRLQCSRQLLPCHVCLQGCRRSRLTKYN